MSFRFVLCSAFFVFGLLNEVCLSVSYFRWQCVCCVFSSLENLSIEMSFTALGYCYCSWHTALICVCVCVLFLYIVFESLVLNGAQTIWLLFFFSYVSLRLCCYYSCKGGSAHLLSSMRDLNIFSLPLIMNNFWRLMKKKKKKFKEEVHQLLFYFNTKITRELY